MNPKLRAWLAIRYAVKTSDPWWGLDEAWEQEYYEGLVEIYKDMSRIETEEMLSELRGSESICGCGRPLLPMTLPDGRKGVTHIFEDNEYHIAYFSGVRVQIEGAER